MIFAYVLHRREVVLQLPCEARGLNGVTLVFQYTSNLSNIDH